MWLRNKKIEYYRLFLLLARKNCPTFEVTPLRLAIGMRKPDHIFIL